MAGLDPAIALNIVLLPMARSNPVLESLRKMIHQA
jgi:hypothetical protein